MNLAIWSGPRNLSTALMYSFAQRRDTRVWDEPFYAAYLARTGVHHPLREEIIAAYQTDPAEIIAACTAPGEGVFYQKHMCQHILPGDDLGWLVGLTNILLIRHPARVIASYAAKRENPVADDLGFAMQAKIYGELAGSGPAPLVIDATDIRANPRAMLERLCHELGLEFDAAMLAWPKGGLAEDGLWAAHWYGAIHGSTGFAGAEGPLPDLPASLEPVVEQCLPAYEALFETRLTF